MRSASPGNANAHTGQPANHHPVGGSRSLRAKVLLWLALLFPAASEAQPGIADVPVNHLSIGGWRCWCRWLVVFFLCLVVGALAAVGWFLWWLSCLFGVESG